MSRAPHGCSVGLEDLPHQELLEYARAADERAERWRGERDEAKRKVAESEREVRIATTRLSGMTQRAQRAESAETLVTVERERGEAIVEMSEANRACLEL